VIVFATLDGRNRINALAFKINKLGTSFGRSAKNVRRVVSVVEIMGSCEQKTHPFDFDWHG
jgi:hypothetical protein